MNQPAEQKPPRYVTCHCQFCDGHIEFDANEFAEENSIVPCPHCGLETKIFIPVLGFPSCAEIKQALSPRQCGRHRRGQVERQIGVGRHGALPENVNYAVKSSFLLSFLESVPAVSAKLKEPITADRKFEEVVKSAQDAAVLVLVY
jgi:hypothetical protein